MVRLTDDGFIPGKSVQFRLTEQSGLQKDIDRAINGSETDAMTLFQQVIAHLLYRRMALGDEQRRPYQLPLRSFLELLFREELLQFFALFHRRPIIRYSYTL